MSHIIGINQSANMNVCEIFMGMNLLDKRVPQLWVAIKQPLVRYSQRERCLIGQGAFILNNSIIYRGLEPF